MLITTVTAYGQKHQHNDHLFEMLEHYMEVKDALTEDDESEAREHLKNLSEEAKNNEEMKSHEDHAEMHAEHHGQMLEALGNAQSADNIDDFRSAFADISKHLAKAVENQDYEGGEELHLQYCPMANNNDGAHWLSRNEEIINPYMGEKMPSCGVQKEHVDY
ncbi:DUF3347 domain-containing protein [Aliifodinibius salipaludis]|uniref:DUF3347 domain-containing protein n=1 Tax=Fodinibius salipaludis TaxID=2032627 RepID=UPI001140C5A2|nr:DUF3347 domain-containing protein [Aliifodinibius salipaludis]